MIFDEMIESLEQNILLPAYSAERRIDLFIELWLPDILSQYYGSLVGMVVPEFPLKIDEGSNRSDKLDYLCVFKKTMQPILVELKTDVHSFDKDQASMYVVKTSDWKGCIKGLEDIVKSEGMPFFNRRKYLKLLIRLNNNGIIDMMTSDRECLSLILKEIEGKHSREISRKCKTDINAWLKNLKIEVAYIDKNIAELVYIVPETMRNEIDNACSGKAKILSFTAVAGYAENIDQEYRKEFDLLFKLLTRI
jgi:hypothetical protein